MASPVIKYTTNKTIDHFNAGATLMKLTGYVDCIEGLKELPNSSSRWIFKFILNNNNGKSVRVFSWGDDAVGHSHQIMMYQILKLTGEIIKEADPTYRRSGDTVGSKEFQVGRGSTLEILGMFDVAKGAGGNQKEIVSYQSIQMKNVSEACGPVAMTGWIKEHFRSISTTNSSSYGSGMICTDVHRMSIHITTFVPRDDLLEGMKVEVKGRIDRRMNAFMLNVSTMDQITLIPGAPKMSEAEMDDAVESPPLTIKRNANESSQNGNEKRQKID